MRTQTEGSVITAVLKSGIQYLESRIHEVESRIEDYLGFPYMGRGWTDSPMGMV